MFREIIRRILDRVFLQDEEIVVRVPSLTNANVMKFERTIGSLSGVQQPGVDTLRGYAWISFDPKVLNQEMIVNFLREHGFDCELVPESPTGDRYNKGLDRLGKSC